MRGSMTTTVPAAAVLVALALGAVSVGGTDDDDCPDADECMTVTAIRVTCKGNCVDGTGARLFCPSTRAR